jgi:hypothetical protein
VAVEESGGGSGDDVQWLWVMSVVAAVTWWSTRA